MSEGCITPKKLEVPKVAPSLTMERPESYTLKINSRPASFKNNRQLTTRGGKLATLKSKYAIDMMNAAKWELKSQWKGEPSIDCWDIEIWFYYKDKKSWLDSDGAYAFVLDCLKGVVIEDDSYKYVGDTYLNRPRLSRNKKDYIEITLTKREE